MNNWKLTNFLVLAALAVGIAACGADTTRVKSDLNVKRAPDWVNEGYQAIRPGKMQLVHGRGIAENMNDLSLQRSVADNRARAEVAQFLNTYLSALSTDYSAFASSGEEPINEAAVSRQIKALTEQNLSGVEIIANWRDKKTGQLWSLAEFRLDRFMEIADASQSLNRKFKDYIKNNAENIFRRVSGGE